MELERQVTSNHFIFELTGGSKHAFTARNKLVIQLADRSCPMDLSARETEGSVLHSSAAGDDSMRHRG